MPKQSQKKSQSQSRSQSRSQSQSQSKNGGRGRKKRTMRKLRRGRKSRKVMRGGATKSEIMTAYDASPQKGNIIQQLNHPMVSDRDTLEMAIGFDVTVAQKVQKLLGLPQ